MPRPIRLWLLTLASIIFVGCKSNVTSANVQVDSILVVKSEHSLTLMAKGKPLKSYQVALGRGPGMAKLREGDHETPEGLYTIDGRNIHSHFHRALHISYPNVEDRERAKAAGVAPGGQIMIHGIQNGLGWLGSLHRTIDWTDGCVAVTDSEIDEIWNLVPVGTPVEIRH